MRFAAMLGAMLAQAADAMNAPVAMLAPHISTTPGASFFSDGAVRRSHKGGRRVRPAMPTGARRAARAKAKKRTRARRWK